MKGLDGKKNVWKKPNSYHVTQLFIGGNPQKKDHKILKNFLDGQQVKVVVGGVVYVPQRILTAVCFPKAEIENEFPHMTLMLGGNWTAKLSNAVLQETCKQVEKFKNSYKECQNNNIKDPFVQQASANIQVTKSKSEQVEAYFIGFDKHSQITFEGITKKFD